MNFNWFIWFVLLVFSGVLLINAQRNPRRIRRFCRRFGIPDELLNSVRNGFLGVGMVLILISALIWFKSVKLPFIISLFLLAGIGASAVVLAIQSRAYLGGNPAQREAQREIIWASMSGFWLPAFITLLIIMAAFSC